MFTGLYADTHSVNLPQSIINEKKDTLATVLQRNGYDTGAIVCAPLLSKRFGLQQGFGDYDTDLIGMTPRLASEAKVGPDVTRKALNWLDRHLDRPFFLFLHYWDVHYDYNPPDKYAALFDPDYQGEMNGMYIHERRDVVPGTPPRDLQHLSHCTMRKSGTPTMPSGNSWPVWPNGGWTKTPPSSSPRTTAMNFWSTERSDTPKPVTKN
jgi:arylsulfatase A-like enzyme